MWKIKLPSLPTFIFNILKFFISVAIMIYAIDTHNYVFGILSLILVTIDVTVDYKRNKKF
jgi:hypothetical protein